MFQVREKLCSSLMHILFGLFGHCEFNILLTKVSLAYSRNVTLLKIERGANLGRSRLVIMSHNMSLMSITEDACVTGMVTDSPTAGRKDSKKKKESTKGASQSTGPACEVPVLLKNSKYLARFPVPHDKRPWNVSVATF